MNCLVPVQVFLAILFTLNEISCETSSCVSTPPEALRCGKALGPNDDHISHSPYQFIENNERCVWTISSLYPRSTFQFRILYMGFPPMENDTDSGPRLSISVPLSQSQYIVSGLGNINMTATSVMIVFSSGPNDRSSNMTGFILEYEVNYPSSQNHFVSFPPAFLRYNKNISSGEVDTSLVVIPPRYNYFPGTIFPLIYLEALSNPQNACWFRQNIGYFDRNNVTHPWQNQTSFCGGSPTASIPGHDDIVVITSAIAVSGDLSRDQWYFHSRCY